MSSRRLLISTCVFALMASPALPQTTTAQAPVMQQSAQAPARAAPSMRHVLRDWGLVRPSRGLQFQKGPATPERAEFSAIVMTDNNGSNATLDNLVITRSNTPGPASGYFTITADKFNDADGTSIGRISMTGLRGGTNLLQAIKAASKAAAAGSRSNRQTASTSAIATTPAVADLVSMIDVTTSLKAGSEAYTAKFGQIDITNLSFDTQLRGFDTVAITNAIFDYKLFSARVATLNLRGIAPALLTQFEAKTGQASRPFDIVGFSLGHFSMTGLTYTFKGENNQPPPLNTMSIDNFSVDNVKDGFIGRFNLSGLKLNGGVGAKAVEASLTRFSMTDVNMRYFNAVGTAIKTSFAAAFAQRRPTVTNESVERVDAPTAPTTSPPTTAATPVVANAGPALKIKDLMKGGPLDSGVNSFDVSGLNVSGAGFGFTLDQIGIRQVRNSNNIITRLEFVPSLMRFSWPTQAPIGGGVMTSFTTLLGTDHIALRFSGAATFSPQTDLITVDNYETEIVDWGKFKLDFALTGVSQLMSEMTMEELYAAAMPKATTSPNPGPRQELNQLFRFYKGVTINSARAEIFDLGGIDMAAKIYAAMRSRGGTTQTPISADQRRAIREGWALTFRDASGNKTKPAIERQFTIALARWLETGGSITLEANPPTPIAISALESQANISPAAWGLRITNRSASAPIAR